MSADDSVMMAHKLTNDDIISEASLQSSGESTFSNEEEDAVEETQKDVQKPYITNVESLNMVQAVQVDGTPDRT